MSDFLSSIDPQIAERIRTWSKPPYDTETRSAIQELLAKQPEQLIDAFFADLSFGTGGLRALMGIGTHRINRYTIQFATQGLANHLRRKSKGPLKVLIGFDSRHHSSAFADETARVLAGNKIHVYLLPELRPTPYVSFACRHKGCDAAIMITASHNPKEYNGYKVYGADGAQIVHPDDVAIVEEAAQIHSPSQVQLAPLDDSLIERVDLAECDLAYLNAIAPLQHFSKENRQEGASLPITYTPLHGTGMTMIPQALKSWGFTNLHFVASQMQPDGDFPTTPFPNPEYPQALEQGLQTMKATDSSLLLASDPDADRLGVVTLHQGAPFIFDGNQVAALCVDYLTEVLDSRSISQGTFVTTIVSTELIKAIAAAHDFQCVEVLTGFKYIGEKIRNWESSATTFLFGAEESYGYLLGTVSRDKDAIIASCLLAEMALYAKRSSETLVDRLYRLYQKYGLYREKQASLPFSSGKEGMEEMAQFMHRLRTQNPQTLCGQKVIEVADYLKGIATASNTTRPLQLPTSDVLSFRLEDQTRLVIRPSGTEPKIKIYASIRLKDFKTVEEGMALCDKTLTTILKTWNPYG